MNFNFDFGWLPFVWRIIGILTSVMALLGVLAGAVLLARRLVLAWRNWGHPVGLLAFASRGDLLNDRMQVVGLLEGKPIARAKDLIVDLRTGRVAGFKVGPFWRRRLLPFDRVKGIGRDAITVESAADLREPTAQPELASLAATKYLWDYCEVMTETGSKLGTTSLRRVWYNRTDGGIELEVEGSNQSAINAVLSWVIELASVFEPLEDWIGRPGRLSVRVPLRTVRSANRKMLILNPEGETQFRQIAQDQARCTREKIESSCGKLKWLMRRRERGSSGPTSSLSSGASFNAPQAPKPGHEERIVVATEPADS